MFDHWLDGHALVKPSQFFHITGMDRLSTAAQEYMLHLEHVIQSTMTK